LRRAQAVAREQNLEFTRPYGGRDGFVNALGLSPATARGQMVSVLAADLQRPVARQVVWLQVRQRVQAGITAPGGGASALSRQAELTLTGAHPDQQYRDVIAAMASPGHHDDVFADIAPLLAAHAYSLSLTVITITPTATTTATFGSGPTRRTLIRLHPQNNTPPSWINTRPNGSV
jgi:hypothetical protein